MGIRLTVIVVFHLLCWPDRDDGDIYMLLCSFMLGVGLVVIEVTCYMLLWSFLLHEIMTVMVEIFTVKYNVTVFLLVAAGLTVMVVLLGLNAAVVVEVCRMQKNRGPGGQDGKDDDKAMQTHFVALILCISVLFVTCNAPFLVRS